MLEYLYLFCIVAAISVFLATPLGFTPGTDLHVARVYQADKYVKIVREFADKIRDGQIITNAGFDEFRKLWQAMEEGNSPTKFVMDRSSRTLGLTNLGNSGRRWKRRSPPKPVTARCGPCTGSKKRRCRRCWGNTWKKSTTTKNSSSRIIPRNNDPELFTDQSLRAGQTRLRPQQPPGPKTRGGRIVPPLADASVATRHHTSVPLDVQFHPFTISVFGVIGHPPRTKVYLLSTGERDSPFFFRVWTLRECNSHLTVYQLNFFT